MLRIFYKMEHFRQAEHILAKALRLGSATLNGMLHGLKNMAVLTVNPDNWSCRIIFILWEGQVANLIIMVSVCVVVSMFYPSTDTRVGALIGTLFPVSLQTVNPVDDFFIAFRYSWLLHRITSSTTFCSAWDG